MDWKRGRERGVGREDTFIDANGLILETRQRMPQETERIAEFLALQLSDVLIVKFQTIRFAVRGRQSQRWVPA